jgi:glycosyltransferase involved in cell wall biosynthesis
VKVYLNNINENWVVDRFRNDWIKNNLGIHTESIKECQVIWIISPWTWKNTPKKYLKRKNVLCSIYHLDFDKKNSSEKKEFFKRDKYVDRYHVISKYTYKELRNLTKKPIMYLPFWIDDKVFFPINDKNKIKQKWKVNKKDYLIGSFQRDSEGKNPKLPKLIKGPDIFFDIVKDIHSNRKEVRVILTGKRRDYLINRLKEDNIPYNYYENISMQEINELYNILDMYIVSSRLEGGPQAILESAITKTPIISTDVGIAPEVLSQESIFNDVKSFKKATPNVQHAFIKVQQYKIDHLMKKYNQMLLDIYEN